MLPSWIGVLIFIAGSYLLLRGSIVAMLVFLLSCSLMGGAAALFLPALGGASVQPAYFAIAFLIARLVLPGSRHGTELVGALAPNVFFVVFVAYGVLTALLLPRIFTNAMYVVPLRPGKLSFLLETVPLTATSQNVTTMVYLTGSLLAGLAATVVGRDPRAPLALARGGAVIAGVHVFLGWSGALLAGTFYSTILAAFRNASYAQLDQSFEGIVRLAGIMPEASSYATYAFIWFVFHCECWLRNIETRWTGPACAALAVTLVASTSSTAYVSLAAYLLLLGVRAAVLPGSIDLRKCVQLVQMSWVVATICVVIAALDQRTATRFSNLLMHFTVDKVDSTSGVQRSFWAKQGLDAFFVSFGLGIGAGSFRSSSIATAILGSMGVVGVISFVSHLAVVFKPLRKSTYLSRADDDRSRVGAAASWTALTMLIPAVLTAPSPNPGIEFAVFAGLALAFRRTRSEVRMPAEGSRPSLMRSGAPAQA